MKGKTTKTLLLLCALSAFLSAAAPHHAFAAQDLDARLREIAAEYEGRPAEAAGVLDAGIVAKSDDVLIGEGDWVALARRYENMYVSGDIRQAPSAQRLASWWNSLGDDVLTHLIFISLQNNRDLEVARSRVNEARAALGVSKADLLPWLDSVNSWTNADGSDNSTAPGSANIYRLGIDASWEIDIFGGQRQKVRAAEGDLAAAYADLHNAWVSLSSEVALNYLNLRTLQARLDIARQNLSLQTDTLELLQSQYDSGLTDALALNQAKYTVEQTKATIPPLQEGIETSMNALAILCGTVPGSLEELLGKALPIPQVDPANLVGIPAEALRRRPDIQSAEMQLLAQTARKKSAKTDLYPKLNLIGSIGLESLSTGSLFSSDSYGFSFGPRITWPIFHGGAIRKNIEVQTAREEQLLAAYEGTVLRAVAEVRNALAADTQERQRNEALRRGVEAARTAVDVAEDKYRNGLSDFNNVISAQAALLSLQDQYMTSEGQLTSNVVQLFKALGGGWEPLMELDAGTRQTSQQR
jgi:efflux transporter, outer membrane factor (OMF) lipoprotein, NodT family